jgi:hypothetical protein
MKKKKNSNLAAGEAASFFFARAKRAQRKRYSGTREDGSEDEKLSCS